MNSHRILLIQGHPDDSAKHLGHVLEDAYAQGALRAGHEVRRIRVAALEFPLLKSQQNWLNAPLPASLLSAQEDIKWAQHIVLFFPLWLGDMPAVTKGFLEQVARPGFAFKYEVGENMPKKLLTGRSARLVVTMGMPALLYRWYFRPHSINSLERNILGFVGFAPVHATLIGMTDKLGEAGVKKWQKKLYNLGEKAC